MVIIPVNTYWTGHLLHAEMWKFANKGLVKEVNGCNWCNVHVQHWE